jgi:ubiquinone/menaquinone biosynthesis C-methylase UbiE
VNEFRPTLEIAYRDADAFRRFWAAELAEAGSRLLAGLPLQHADRVLDLGAGIGVNVPGIRAAAPRALVVAADLVEAMIRAAPSDARRVCVDAMAICFDDDVFDAVLMAFMLFHVPEPARALAEVRRVLHPGGWVAVGSWFAPAEVDEPDAIWNEALDEAGAAPIASAMSKLPLMATPDKLAALLEANGFIDVRTGSEEFVDSISGAAEFVARRTRLGTTSVRFASLPPAARTTFLERARAVLERLPPDRFVTRERALFAWARRA